jgi:hypothetical protein
MSKFYEHHINSEDELLPAPAEHGQELYVSHPVPDTYEGWKQQAAYLSDEYNKLADRWSEEHDRAEVAADRERVLVEAIEEYLLWEPGRKGHAAAHARLVAVVREGK